MKESESLDLFIFFTQENLLLDGLPSYYVSLLEESIVTLKRIFHGISAHQEAFALSIVSKIQLAPPHVLNYEQKVLDRCNFLTDFWL